MQDDSMLTRNNSLESASAVLCSYFENGVSIVPELSTRSMNDEIIRDDGCLKTIKNFLELENSMQFQELERKFEVIDDDTVPAVVDAALAKAIASGKGDWSTLQKKSVSIRRYKVKSWNLKAIAGDVYQWTLGYDDFLGYMYGVLNMGGAVFC